MKKIVLKRENHTLEITENSVIAWLNTDEIKKISTSNIVIRNNGDGWAIEANRAADIESIDKAWVCNVCDRDALQATHVIETYGFHYVSEYMICDDEH